MPGKLISQDGCLYVQFDQKTKDGFVSVRLDQVTSLEIAGASLAAMLKQEPKKWQESRALGELSGVPRRRVGVGLRLTGRRTVQAWARDHRRFRAVLSELIPETVPPGGPAETDVEDGSSW